MQAPISKGSSDGFKRLAKKIAKVQNGLKPTWHLVDSKSISDDSSKESIIGNQPSPLGITRDPSSDFETGYKFYLNINKHERL